MGFSLDIGNQPVNIIMRNNDVPGVIEKLVNFSDNKINIADLDFIEKRWILAVILVDESK